MVRARTLVPVTALLLAALPGTASAKLEFREATSRDVPTVPQFLAVGDLNEDGIDDIVVSSPNSDQVSILLMGPNVEPIAEETLPLAEFRKPQDIAVADINGDGHLDVVVADIRSRAIFLFLGSGTGQFAASNVVEVDLPRDNRIEGRANGIAVANFDCNRETPTSPCQDTDLDIAVSDRNGNRVVIFLNDGNRFPAFTTVEFPVGEKPRDVLAADFNGDGNTDFAVFNSARPVVRDMTVYLFDRIPAGTGRPIFRKISDIIIDRSPNSFILGDFDDDGFQDIAYLNEPGQDLVGVQVEILLTRPDGLGGVVFTRVDPPFTVPCPEGALLCTGTALAAADLDNEGALDLVVAVLGDRLTRLRHLNFIVGRGNGFFALEQTFSFNENTIKDIAVGRFSDNDFLDVVIVQSRRFLRLFENVSGLLAGEPCVDDSECQSGVCVDGVCCNRKCTNEETCVAPGREGVCTAFTPTPTRTPGPNPPRGPGEPCTIDADCRSDLFCTDGTCCFADRCPNGFFCVGFADDIDDPAAIPGVCFPGTKPPTRIPSPTPTPPPPTIIADRGGGGCSAVPEGRGADTIALLLLGAAGLWWARRRRPAEGN